MPYPEKGASHTYAPKWLEDAKRAEGDDAAEAQTARENAARTLQDRGLPHFNATRRMSPETKYLGYTATDDEDMHDPRATHGGFEGD